VGGGEVNGCHEKYARTPKSVDCYKELSLAISCRGPELSYYVSTLKGSDGDYGDRRKQKAETGRDKKDTEKK
jgi:hypothetical protein